MATSKEKFQLERLKAEIEHERQMQAMLRDSLKELQLTCEELERRGDEDDEGSEWKSRYETQVETNAQLQGQAILVQHTIDDAKRALKERRMPKSPFTNADDEDETEVNDDYIHHLEYEKQMLLSQLKDLEWKLDQEAKAFHKANEERKGYISEIAAARSQIIFNQQKTALAIKEKQDALEQTPTAGYGNIPQDQRVIDSRRGPIKKTAAVRQLPPL